MCVYLLTAKPCISYGEARGRDDDEPELVPAVKGTDGPMGKADLHVYSTRKWLFRFLSDGQAFCKDELCECKAGTAISHG